MIKTALISRHYYINLNIHNANSLRPQYHGEEMNQLGEIS